MSQAVREILERIDHLPENERQELDELLAQRAEDEWKQAAEDARRMAREKGIDQAAIDDAIEQVRHGS
jgi:2-iminoacetate synthase ThiH